MATHFTRFEAGDMVRCRTTRRLGTVESWQFSRGATSKVTRARKYTVVMSDTGKREYFNQMQLVEVKTVLSSDIEGDLLKASR